MRFLSRSARFSAKSRRAAISRLFVRAIPSLRPRFVVSILALSGASRQLPQRGSHWRAGPLFAGCLRPDRAQKSGPRLRGQRLLNKSALSSCCESRPQGTTVSDKIKLCLSRVGLTGTPVPLPLGEVALRSNDGEGYALKLKPPECGLRHTDSRSSAGSPDSLPAGCWRCSGQAHRSQRRRSWRRWT